MSISESDTLEGAVKRTSLVDGFNHFLSIWDG